MFCLYSPACSPSAYLSLQRPLPLWAAPPLPHLGPGIPLSSGVHRGLLDPSEERRLDSRLSGISSRGKDGSLERNRLLPFQTRGTTMAGNSRRPESAGAAVFYPPAPSPGLPPCKVKYPVDGHGPGPGPGPGPVDDGLYEGCRRWNTGAASFDARQEPKEGEESEMDEEREEEAGRGEMAGRQRTLHQDDDAISKDDTTVTTGTVANGNRRNQWSSASAIENGGNSSPKGRPGSVVSQWDRLRTSPGEPSSSSSSSSSSSTPKNGSLKFGIDSILRSKDRPTGEGPSEKQPASLYLLQSPHHHQAAPQRPNLPLLSIRQNPVSKAPSGNIGSNFLYTPPVYSQHLFALHGPLHYPPPPAPTPTPSSSSPRTSLVSSSASATAHLRPNILPPPHPPPGLHYSLHHSFQVPNRHSDFPGNTFALLGSTPDLHSPHLHPHSKKKRSWSRAVFSNLQRKGLEKRFEVQKYVTKPDRRQLAAMLGLTDAQVKVWFQNRRMKWRHQEEAVKKKETDNRKPPRRSIASDETTSGTDSITIEQADFEADNNDKRLSNSESDNDDDDDPSADGLISSRDAGGRLHGGDAVSVVAEAFGRTNGIMSVADILDLRKECGIDTGNNDNDDVDDNDEDDDDDGDEISVVSASM